MKSVRSEGTISKKVSFGYTPKGGGNQNHDDSESGVNNNNNNSNNNAAADRDSSSTSDMSDRRKSKIWKPKTKKNFFAHHKARSGDWGGLLLSGMPSRRHSDQDGDERNKATRMNSSMRASPDSDKPDCPVAKVAGKKTRSFSLLQKPSYGLPARDRTSRAMASSVNINEDIGVEFSDGDDVRSYTINEHEYSDGIDRRSSRGSSNGGAGLDDVTMPMVAGTRKSVVRRENIDASAMSMGLDELSANFLDFVSEAKCRDWLKSLSRRDPRYCIKAFFDDMAMDGADNIEKENGFQPELLSPLLSMFQRSSVFSVWRPTSVDSIRKMMTGQGTGKGLDIKGKSAKKGKLSAYVPFLQIHDDIHKTKIRLLPGDERIRVFYKKREARNHAHNSLLVVLNDMVQHVETAERALNFVQKVAPQRSRVRRATASDSVRPSASQLQAFKKRASNIDKSNPRLSALQEEPEEENKRPGLEEVRNNSDIFGRHSQTAGFSPVDRSQWKILDEWAMNDPSIEVIDDYAPKCFGLDIPKRLFWEGYVMRAKDISRAPGSEYDTGRPSRASFQDMNFASIKQEVEEDTPRAVVWQYTDPYLPPNEPDPDPMMPQTLLMAYEEHGSVKPVVSDFDCFLLGTRGVRFHSPLPDDQVKMVHHMVDDIEKILNDCSEGNSTNWTAGWLNEMKRHKTHIKMPKYGFGDPKSYAIMKYAVHRLEEFGAVRHGAECFNYYFPQELDDEFLVIGGNLGAKYKYMTLPELQTFLSDTIDKGFTFPLNPKWVLCDEGWSALWDKLVGSTHPNVQLSISAWYPPGSGLRKRIEEVRQKYPEGYQSDLSGRKKGTQAWDEAEIALERYQRIQRAKRKLYCVLCFISIIQQSQKKVKARQISESTNSGENITDETKKEKMLAGKKDDEEVPVEIQEVLPEKEEKVSSPGRARVSFSDRRSSISSTYRPLEPPSIEQIVNMKSMNQGLLRSQSASVRANGRSSLFRRSSSSTLAGDESIPEENNSVEIIDSLLEGNVSLSEFQKLGLHNIRELFLSKEQNQQQQQHRTRMERRHTTIDARLTSLMLADVPSFIIREYGGDNALNDPVQKLQTQAKHLMNSQGFIAAAGGRSSMVEGPYSGNGSFLPVEWTRLSLEAKKILAKKLSFESLSAWEFNIIDFSKECKGTPLLFIGWAVLGSPFAQKAMASDLGLDPETDVDGYNFVTDFNMKMPILCSFLRAMENDYLPNPYHNNIHAADVVQTLNAMLQLGGKEFAQSNLQIFSILIAAVIHDVR